MIKHLRAVSLAILAVTTSVNLLPACGDKFLVSSRGTRYQRAPVDHGSAAILIYTKASSEVSRLLASVPLDGKLRKAGYRPTIVESSNDFEKALSRGDWDLILVGKADAQALSQRVRSNSGVLPVVFRPSSTELKAVKKLYPVLLTVPAKSQTLLEAVDEALTTHPKFRKAH